METDKIISACYSIPANDAKLAEKEGTTQEWAIARSAIDVAIFKAGRDSFLDDVGNATIPLSEAYKKGMWKVVKWLKENGIEPTDEKLKEWGINEKT